MIAEQPIGASAWTAVRRLIQNSTPEPFRSQMLNLGDAYERGDMERGELDHKLFRIRARALLADGPTRRPFPTGQCAALDYALFRSAIAEARDNRIQRSRGGSIDDSECRGPAAMEPARYSEGREEYLRWYGPIVERFDSIARVVDGLLQLEDPADEPLIARLLDIGDDMAGFYSGQLRSGALPYLPPHYGQRFPNVIRAWDTLRDRCQSIRGRAMASVSRQGSPQQTLGV